MLELFLDMVDRSHSAGAKTSEHVEGFFAFVSSCPKQVQRAHRIDDMIPEFDSIQPIGIGFRDELGGTKKSKIRPEGLAVRTDPVSGTSFILSANEGEGSVTLLRSVCPRP